MSEKNEKFHRLAEKRTAAVVNDLRIFAHCSNPGHEWSPAEVMAYFAKIDAARDEALTCFTATKRWKAAAAAEAPSPDLVDEVQVTVEAGPAEQPPPLPDLPPAASGGPYRKMTIGEVIAAASDDRETLAEIIILQRRVISDQQQRLDKLDRRHVAAVRDTDSSPVPVPHDV